MTDPTDLEVSDKQLAQMSGCSDRLIRKLVQSGALQRVGRNRFRLGDAIPSLIEHLSASGHGATTLVEERTGLVRAQRLKAELEYALARKEVAPLSEMQRGMEWRAGVTRQNVMNIPGRCLTQLLGETNESRFRQVLVDECKAALRQAADVEMRPEDFEDDGEYNASSEETEDNDTEDND